MSVFKVGTRIEVPKRMGFLGKGCPPPQPTRVSGGAERRELPQKGRCGRQCILGIFQDLDQKSSTRSNALRSHGVIENLIQGPARALDIDSVILTLSL